MSHAFRIAALLLCLLLPPLSASAQDLYDPATLRTIQINFHDSDWETRLRANYASATNILADIVVDGVTYPSVGVRIRGNTSYTALPQGSQKFSLKVEMDFVDANQELMGYDTLNFNNGFHDPTFVREVVYNNYVAQFIPNPRANNVVLQLNGQNWGVYVNVQQPDKRMLRDYFTNADGVRISCANNPNGPGLAYVGSSASSYAAYEINNDGGLPDPYVPLITVANALSNTPLASWPLIDEVFAIDPSIWSVVLENALTDDDSYSNKGCDFQTYVDPLDGRMHLMQRDANETFTQVNWAATRNFSASNKPVLSRVLAVAELRQRYLAHYRRVLEDMNWDYFGARFTAQMALIDAAVQADPKKLYSYTLFQNNLTANVTLPYSGPAGGSVVGLQPFITQRATFLATTAELVAQGPSLSNVQASLTAPEPDDPVWITAQATANGSAVANVELFYRPDPGVVYSRVSMLDDGNHQDGSAGDGIWGVQLPVSAVAGQRVSWYVAATASNSYASLSFSPVLAERGPYVLEYGLGDSTAMRITEWMYSGLGGEFIEFTNMGDTPIDLTGWSMDDDHALAGTFDLSAFGIVQAGESVIVTETVASTFRTDWGLDAGDKIIGEMGVVSGNGFGRADQIHLYDATDALVDRLYYGDQTYVGSIRTQNASGQAPCAAIGQNDVMQWQLSVVGDSYGSVAASSGDIGTPGLYDSAACTPSTEDIFADGFE